MGAQTLKYSVTDKTIQPWINRHECVQVYLQHLNSKKLRVACYLHYYCEWAGMSPEQLLRLKNTFENSRAERLLDRFTIAQTMYPDSTKFNVINAVKAFYRMNYRQLQSAAGSFEYTTKKAQASASKEVCMRLFRASYNPRDQALVMVGTGTAIAQETIPFLKWSYFEDDWVRQDVPCMVLPSAIIKGHGKGKYKGVMQVTFLTPEAKRVFLNYREWYQKQFSHVWLPEDFVFLSVKDNVHEPLTTDSVSGVMMRLSKRAGVKYGIHDGRIRVQTALENVGVSPNWVRKIKGRKVKGEEAPYSKPAINQLRRKFCEALGELEFLGEGYGGSGDEWTVDEKAQLRHILWLVKSGKLVRNDSF